MADPRALYNRIILEHGEAPRHATLPETRSHERVATNPLCGDQVHVAVRLAGETIAAIGCRTRGCALSVAAGSIMCEAVDQHTVGEMRALFAELEAMVCCRAARPRARDDELDVFAPVADFPARHECVFLPWHALMAALEEHR